MHATDSWGHQTILISQKAQTKTERSGTGGYAECLTGKNGAASTLVMAGGNKWERNGRRQVRNK